MRRSITVWRSWATMLVGIACFYTLVPGLAQAQSAPSSYTYATRYNAAHQITGTISPDPDGAGPLKYAAVRNTYDAVGRLVKVETGELSSWQSEAVAPSSWGAAFSVLSSVETTYDTQDRKLKEVMKGSDGAIGEVTQYSYDALGRPQCAAIRMNPAVFTSLPADACALGTQGSNGPDRIAKTIYDAAGQVVQVRKAVGTGIEQAYATYSYTQDGQKQDIVDANGNKAELRYDGFDREVRWVFPSQIMPSAFNGSTAATALATAGALNEADYETYGYDANGNRTSLKKRDGSDIAYSYDALDRMTEKNVDANNERTDLAAADRQDVYYSYNARGIQTSARFGSASGQGIVNAIDGFGRVTSATDSLLSGSPVLGYHYDADGNTTALIHPDGAEFDFAFDGVDRLATVKKGSTVLVAPAYTQRGAVGSIDRTGVAFDQSFGYDALGRLSALAIGVTGQTGSAKVGWGYTRNAASQILTEERDNDLYAWLGRQNANIGYTANGLNQYAAVGTAAFCYDPDGNLTDDGTYVYRYDVENRLVEMRARSLPAGSCPSYTAGYTGTLMASLHYDPLGRLSEALKYTAGTLTRTTRFLYDGDALVLEYDGTNAILNRYVHGSNAKADDPLLWYPGSSTADTNARNLYADPRGSIVLVEGEDGTVAGINTYDEWGASAPGNLGRFQYTGQVWLDELGMYYYKARIYSPRLGRFMQTDPIGYADQMDLYAYVGNDPVDGVDPSGKSITEIAFLVYDVGQTINDVANGASAGELINDAANIALDVEPIPGLREAKGAVEIVRAAEKGAEGARAERAAIRATKTEVHHVVPQADRRAADARDNMRANGINPKTDSSNKVTISGDKHDITKRDSYVQQTNARVAAQPNAQAIKEECCRIGNELKNSKTEDLDKQYPSR